MILVQPLGFNHSHNNNIIILINPCYFKFYIMKSLYTESDISQALEALKSGTSLRKAAKDWGIPLTTLHHRSKGCILNREAKQHN
jgi:hypothetical protein